LSQNKNCGSDYCTVNISSKFTKLRTAPYSLLDSLPAATWTRHIIASRRVNAAFTLTPLFCRQHYFLFTLTSVTRQHLKPV